ncbi:MAG: hypothetical protein ABIQ74_12305 [Chitinophagales bacterium]
METSNYYTSLNEADNVKSWETLYDRYAPVMYGVISNLSKDKGFADEIFIKAFQQVIYNKIISRSTQGHCPELISYTYKFAIQQLLQHQIEPKKSTPAKTQSVLNLLFTRCGTLKEAAFFLNLSEDEVKRKLHEEFLELRRTNSSSVFIKSFKQLKPTK